MEIYLAGDSTPPEPYMNTELATSGNFVWSPISSGGIISPSDPDWTNGHAVPGLPSVGLPAETLTAN